MALRFFSIEKEVSFKGRLERFSNVYCYDTAADTEAELREVCAEIISLERPLFRNIVSFVYQRVYTDQSLLGLAGGTMYISEEIPGRPLGTMASGFHTYPECAVTVRWPLAKRDIQFGPGQKRITPYLRKWLHVCTVGSNTGDSVEAALGRGQLSTSYREAVAAYANGVLDAIHGSLLVSPATGEPPVGPPVVNPYLEHRQFHQGPKRT